MCKQEINDRFKELNHVKILAKRFSNVMEVNIGVYEDKGYFRFEEIGARNYICQTVLIEGVREWQA